MKYTGETNSKGEPHVQCTFTYLSSKYTGERKDGIFNGQGTSTIPMATSTSASGRTADPTVMAPTQRPMATSTSASGKTASQYLDGALVLRSEARRGCDLASPKIF